MSGRSSWCFGGDHPGCRFPACTCACHQHPAEAERGVPDSIDGSTDDVVTVALAFRGQRYEVDLSRQHRDDLQAALRPFVAAARQL